MDRSKIRCFCERPACSSCIRRAITCQYASDADHSSTPGESTSVTVAERQTNSLPTTSHRQTLPFPVALVDQINKESLPISQPQVFTDPCLNNVFMDFNLSGPFYESDIQNNFDWMFFEDTTSAGIFNPPGVRHHRQECAMWDQPPPVQAGRTSALAGDGTLLAPALTSDATPSSTMPKSPLDHLSVPSAHHEEDAEDRWPMFWRPEPLSLARLVSLEHAEQLGSFSTTYNLPTTNPDHVKTLIELLKVPSEHWLWSEVDLSCFPNSDTLDQCIDQYFVSFHKYFPFLHRPSFDPGREPMISLAVIAIGACFTNYENACSFSNAMMELSRRLLIHMSESDPRFVRTEYYVATQLLHSIHGFACGSKRSYELAERTRGSLINNARCARLFDDYPEDAVIGRLPDERWRAWIRVEGFRRLSWAIYAFDATSACMRDDRPFLSLNEIKMSLPSPVSHWEAETSQAWCATHPWSASGPKVMRFEKVLENLMQEPERTLSSMKDQYQRYIMLATLTRMMWSYKEQTTQPAARFLTSQAAIVEGKRQLLNIANHFSFSPEAVSNTTTPDDFALRIQQMCLVQLSHILTGDDVWDHLHLIWRPHPGNSKAREHILEWMRQKPRSFRAFTRANARLLNVTRMYGDNHPQESYNAFHAGMAVWVMSLLGPQAQSRCIPLDPLERESHKSRTICHLDSLRGDDTSEGLILQDWVDNGGEQYVVRMHGVPDFFAAEAPRQVLRSTADILNRMPIWGVARAFMNATLRTLNSKD